MNRPLKGAFISMAAALIMVTSALAAETPKPSTTANSAPTALSSSGKMLKKEVKPAEPVKRPVSVRPDRKNSKEIEKTVKGRIVYIRKDLISIEFQQSEEAGGEEMLIRTGKGLKFKGVKKFSDLERDDMVEVKIKQIILPAKKAGEEPYVFETNAFQVTRLKKAEQVRADMKKVADALAAKALVDEKTEEVPL
jgi:hypothetical protein